MKFSVSFKTPYAFDRTAEEYENHLVDRTEQAMLISDIHETMRKFIKYPQEYITIEFDTETQTARVLEVSESY